MDRSRWLHGIKCTNRERQRTRRSTGYSGTQDRGCTPSAQLSSSSKQSLNSPSQPDRDWLNLNPVKLQNQSDYERRNLRVRSQLPGQRLLGDPVRLAEGRTSSALLAPQVSFGPLLRERQATTELLPLVVMSLDSSMFKIINRLRSWHRHRSQESCPKD
jgi:hypothetical protein